MKTPIEYAKIMAKASSLRQTGLISLNTVLQHYQISPSTWYAGVKEGIYSSPVKFRDCPKYLAQLKNLYASKPIVHKKTPITGSHWVIYF